MQELSLEISGNTQVIDQMNTLFYSNNNFRQFHVDIRLILYDFQDMPVHDKILEHYLILFKNLFKHISENTFKCIDKWKNVKLVLGTCNEI